MFLVEKGNDNIGFGPGLEIGNGEAVGAKVGMLGVVLIIIAIILVLVLVIIIIIIIVLVIIIIAITIIACTILIAEIIVIITRVIGATAGAAVIATEAGTDVLPAPAPASSHSPPRPHGLDW